MLDEPIIPKLANFENAELTDKSRTNIRKLISTKKKVL